MYILKPIDYTFAQVTANTALPESDFPAWAAATSYTVGTKVIRATTHRIYQNLIAGVDATLPENAPSRWLDVGPTNAYAFMDGYSSTITSKLYNVSFTIAPGQRISSIALINVVGETVFITATNNGAEQIYNKTITMDATQVATVYDWFFEEFEQKPDHVEVDFPEAYNNPVITVTIAGSSTVSIGRLALTKGYEIGEVEYGAGINIKDYSVTTTDVNNIKTLTKKPNSKLMNFRVVLNQSETNRVNKLLRTLSSVPCIFIGVNAEDYEYTIAHGFYQDFKIILPLPKINYCDLVIEEII